MIITLATLRYATRQEVFDQVAAHLIKQGRRSTVDPSGGCVYRGPDGLMCAAGCLISDEEYKPSMDNAEAWDTSWDGLIKSGHVPKTQHDHLIQELQNAHDSLQDPGFETHILVELRGIAEKYNLKFEPKEGSA